MSDARKKVADALLPPPQGYLPDWWNKGVGEVANAFGRIVAMPRRAMERGVTTEEAIPWAADTAMNLAGVGTPMAASGAAGIFGGRLAATADKAMLATAERMAAEGKSADAILKDTGWFMGPDKKWRFEISDHQSVLNPAAYKHNLPAEKVTAPASEQLIHDALYAAYPSLANIPMSIQRGQVAGRYFSGTEKSPEFAGVVAPNPQKGRQVALHELQHAIQGIEGFSPGKSPHQFHQQADAELARAALSFRREMDRLPPGLDNHAKENAVIEQYRRLGAMDWVPSRQARDVALDRITNPDSQLTELVKAYGLDQRTSPYSSMEMYRRSAGEVEARNVEARRALDGPMRRAMAPWTTEDVPTAQQIVSKRGTVPVTAASEPTPPGIRAYHGSPHDFDRFDMSKIGTGEGAQAYGHGLYFAENPATARGYKRKLSGVFGRGVNDDLIRSASGGLSLNKEHLAVLRHFASEDNLSALDAAKRVQWRFPELRDDGRAGVGEIHRGLMAAIEQTRNAGKGRMYEVNIKAKPEDFLDWDKPVHKQRSNIQNAIQGALTQRVDQSPEAVDMLRGLARGREYAASDAYSALFNPWDRKGAAGSEALRDAGIPGIRYLDQGSRRSGEGSSNYVVFDAGLIDILKKWGLAGAATMLGVSQSDIVQAMPMEMPGLGHARRPGKISGLQGSPQ